MIQRIQTIFLLLASGSAFSLFAFPFAKAQTMSQSIVFADGLYNLQDNIGLLILFCLAGILTFVGIFLFRNRKTQLLVNRIAIVANIIGLVLTVILFMNDQPNMTQNVTPDDGLGAYLPFVFLIFAFLANHFINKDEKLVKSMDRLR